MIDNKLIEKALALTDENIEDMMEWVPDEIGFGKVFSMEKFCYYLISLDFLYSYEDKIKCDYQGKVFLHAIQDFQEGNEEPLKELLSKIGN